MQMFNQASDFVPIVRNLHYVHLWGPTKMRPRATEGDRGHQFE